MSNPSPIPPKPPGASTPQIPPAPPKPVLPPKGIVLSTSNAPAITLPKAPPSGESSTTAVIIPGKAPTGPSMDKTADLKLPAKPALPGKATPPVSTPPVATGPAAPKAPQSPSGSLPAKPASNPAKPVSTPAKPTGAAATRPITTTPLLDDEPKGDYINLGLAIILNLLAWGASGYFYHFMPMPSQ